MKFLSMLLVAISATGCGLQGPTGGLQGATPALRTGTGVSGDRYLVKFRAGVSASAQDALLKRAGATTLREVAALGVRSIRTKSPSTLIKGVGVEYVEVEAVRRAPEAWNRRAGGAAIRAASSAKGTYAAVKVAGATSVSRRVTAAEPRQATDPLAAQQWGLDAIGTGYAWNRTMGSPEIIVAVVDTGIDLSHPDLRGRLVPGISFVNEITRPSGEPGDDEVVPFKNVGPVDDNGHGTHVAGIIAAEANNGEGGAGVAPGCKLMPVKVLGYNTRGFDGDVSAGIVWAADHGAKVINMSLGGEGGGQTLERAVRYAQARGAIVIAAMGNDGEDAAHAYGSNVNYPASYAGVVAVAATDSDGSVAGFSNHGTWTGVAAPGVRILSTAPTYDVWDPMQEGYDRLSGTSMATPFVAGVAALLASANPSLRGPELRQRLLGSAGDILFPGFDLATGQGLVDAGKALGQ